MAILERRVLHRAVISTLIICSILSTCMSFQSNILPSSNHHHRQPQRRASIYTTIPNTQNRISTTSTSIHGFFDEPDELIGQDKLKACIPYVLPLIDGDMFGRYIFDRIPPLHTLHELLLAPLVRCFEYNPFFPIILFVVFCIGTRNAEGMSRLVRFNAQQAVLLDVALILPTWLAQAVSRSGDVPRVVDEAGCNFVYYVLMAGVLYSCWCNLNGKKPDEIPYVSGAAEFMVGPF